MISRKFFTELTQPQFCSLQLDDATISHASPPPHVQKRQRCQNLAANKGTEALSNILAHTQVHKKESVKNPDDPSKVLQYSMTQRTRKNRRRCKRRSPQVKGSKCCRVFALSYTHTPSYYFFFFTQLRDHHSQQHTALDSYAHAFHWNIMH